MSEEFLVFLDEPDESAKPTKTPKKIPAKSASGKKDDGSSEFVILLDEPKQEKSDEFVILLDQDDSAAQAASYRLASRSSIEQAAEIRDGLKKALAEASSKLSIDASDVEYIDTAILQMLAYFSEHCGQRGNSVTVVKASEEFNACCARLNFEKYLKIAA